jgi:hypothetical protein
MPQDTTPLRDRCIGLHEYYTELIAAGFTPAEAMEYLIGTTAPDRKGAR